jgi:hypothetical protein
MHEKSCLEKFCLDEHVIYKKGYLYPITKLAVFRQGEREAVTGIGGLNYIRQVLNLESEFPKS